MTALDGYRVLDFSQGICGPMATMLLSDFNAEVIKVEPPAGDRMRDHPGYLAWNRNKQRVVIDLERPDGRAAARELLKTADVAVFDSAPGDLERLGLDSKALLDANPVLLHVWLPMFGRSGEWSGLPHDDGLLAALTGHAFAQFSYEDVPVWFVAPMVSYHYGIGAATAIVASLYERLQSGRGQALVLTGLHALGLTQSGSAIQAEGMLRVGDLLPGARGFIPNYRLYRCGDGEWIFLGTLTQKFFLQALEAMGLVDLLAHPDIEGDYGRLTFGPGKWPAVDALDRRFAEKPRADWLKILEDADVPRAAVGTREEWFRSDVISANAMRVELEHPDLGRVLVPGVPAKLSENEGSVRHLVKDVALSDLPAHAPVRQGGRHGTREGGPLAGVKVLDLGGYIAGTFGPTVLAALGADVIKVEGVEGDPFRFLGLTAAGHNQGKRSLAIDMKNGAAMEALHDLVRGADLVLDNFRRGVPERLGVDYESLKKVNPRIISCSVTGYGRGPMADRPGFDPLVQAESGMMLAQGGTVEPVFYQLAMNDESTAIMNAFGMLVALVARERFGHGQKVETALVNQSILLQSGELTWYEGRPPAPVGEMDCRGVSAFRRMYECADGWIAVACTSTDQAERFCEALGHGEWLRRAAPPDPFAEPRHGVLAVAAEAALLATQRDAALSTLLGAGVPAVPALRFEELLASGWVADEGFFMETVHPLFGTMKSVRGYAAWDRTPSSFRRGSPMVGEHSFEVLEECGVSPERIAALLEAGAIVQWSGPGSRPAATSG